MEYNKIVEFGRAVEGLNLIRPLLHAVYQYCGRVTVGLKTEEGAIYHSYDVEGYKSWYSDLYRFEDSLKNGLDFSLELPELGEGLELYRSIIILGLSRCDLTTRLTKVSQSGWKKSKRSLEIIGESANFKQVLEQLSLVSDYDTFVLLQGESGTGKELLAGLLHQNSPRSKRKLVSVNCGAIPPSLAESLFFGHKKGSFTGAHQDTFGYFYEANKGTLFLDEIGDLPLDLQVKLLRVLESGEYQRIGSTEVLKTDLRIITATNKKLLEEVQAGRFREDLYYRLSAFPVEIPPLRERSGDIILLCDYFIQRLCTKMGIPHPKINSVFYKTAEAYSWPGNIRQLRNEIEKALILNRGGELTFSFAEIPREDLTLSFDDQVKSIITETLKACDGKVQGSGGAAERLGLNPQTLYSKIRKYGI